MGLDMYLFQRNINRRVDSEVDDIEIGYWRKFNALHHYILELTESAPDSNCEAVDLTEENIKVILADLYAIKEVLDASTVDEDGVYDEEVRDKVCDIMPPASGFFWGDVCVDDYYAHNITESINIFENALKLIRDGEDIYYYCWW